MVEVLRILGGLSLLGALIGMIKFWPDSSALEVGYVYKITAYIPSIAFGVSGVVSAIMFFAVASILKTQYEIQRTLEYVQDKIIKSIYSDKNNG